MAVGKISYNGGSGVKGAAETTYTVHADSAEIKAGNFVEKVAVENIQHAVISDIVLNTKVTQTSSMVEMGNNRLLIAISEQDVCRFRLYDTKQNTVPVLLDEHIFTENVITMDMVQLNNNLVVVACDIGGSSINAFALSTTDDKIIKGNTTGILGSNVGTIKLGKFNQTRFIAFGRINNNLHYTSYMVSQDLSLSGGTISDVIYGVNNNYISCENVALNKVIATFNSGTHGGGLEVAIFTYTESSNTLSKAGTIGIESNGYQNSVKVISDTRAIVVYKSTNTKVDAAIINMDKGSTVGTLSVTKISTLASSLNLQSVITLVEYEIGKYMIVHNGDAYLLAITDDTVTMGEAQAISTLTDDLDIAVPMNNRVTILYKNSNNYPTLTQVSVNGSTINNNVPYVSYVYEIQKAISKIDGVAKKSGVAGDEIVIYTLGGNA